MPIGCVGCFYISPGVLNRTSGKKSRFNPRSFLPPPWLLNVLCIGFPLIVTVVIVSLGSLGGREYREFIFSFTLKKKLGWLSDPIFYILFNRSRRSALAFFGFRTEISVFYNSHISTARSFCSTNLVHLFQFDLVDYSRIHLLLLLCLLTSHFLHHCSCFLDLNFEAANQCNENQTVWWGIQVSNWNKSDVRFYDHQG